MYFKRLEINGFKSFADPVVIEFTDGMTCIVGPNGSGKSNISDAIRWVLGEQSPKNLRGGKMEEVIFAGTQNRKPKGMAEVTLVIDNSTHILPIDYSEVGITRRMYRSGESEYMINRSPCRLRDIRDLIMDTGIGVEGYSIISQGRIAEIINDKMEKRREIFEEAAGIVKYRTRKTEAERKLEAAKGNLDRVSDIVREIEGRIGGLEEDSRKASEYLQLREKYQDVEINIILKNIAAAEEKSGAVKTESEELARAIEETEAARGENEALLKEQRSLSEEIGERLESLRSELLAKTEEIHELSGRDELNRERLLSLEKERTRLTGEIAASEERRKAESERLAGAEAALAAAGEELRTAAEEADEKHKAAEKAAQASSQAQEAIDSARNRIFEISGRLGSVSTEKSGIEGLKQTLERRLERLTGDQGYAGARESLETKLSGLEKDLAKYEDEKKKAKDGLAKAFERRAEAQLRAGKAASDAEALRLSSGKLSARVALLDELEKAYEGYGGGVRFLMGEKLGGIIGVLGDLLEVPKGCEVAVETVLGAKLQDIVCEDDDTAKKAIDLLKKNKAGRLTFLPVKSLRPGKPMDPGKLASMDGYVGLASEMVGCRGGYTNVTDYMLGRVVICETLENAVAMSKKTRDPFRFVSLEGDIVNSAGAVTGGSLRNNTGNILSRKAEKEDLIAEVKELSKQIEAAEKAHFEFDAESGDLGRRCAELEKALRQAEMNCVLVENDIKTAGGSLADMNAGEERRLSEIADIRKEIEAADADIKGLEERAASLEKEMKQAETEAGEAAGRLDSVRDAYAKAMEAETAARLALSEKQNAESNARLGAGRSREYIGELDAARKKLEEGLESVALQVSQIESFSEGAGKGLEELGAEKQSIEAGIEKASADRKEAAARADGFEAERNILADKLYGLQSKKHESELRLARYEAQAESLREKLWDEFEMSYAQAAEHEAEDFVMSRALKESKEYRDRIRELGDVNIGAIEEYRAVKERYDFLSEQKADIEKAMGELTAVITDMDRTIKKRFKDSFDAVVENFEAVFTDLFGGGHARLSMEDPEHPLETAIEIEAQPPGKKLQNINLLSGGEKTMTAIALMFAVLRAKPTPFCILDEVEAALDERNIDCFARYLEKFDNTQFALITHQKATMEYADALYGVTMPEHGITKVLSLRLGDSFEVGN